MWLGPECHPTVRVLGSLCSGLLETLHPRMGGWEVRALTAQARAPPLSSSLCFLDSESVQPSVEALVPGASVSSSQPGTENLERGAKIISFSILDARYFFFFPPMTKQVTQSQC